MRVGRNTVVDALREEPGDGGTGTTSCTIIFCDSFISGGNFVFVSARISLENTRGVRIPKASFGIGCGQARAIKEFAIFGRRDA